MTGLESVPVGLLIDSQIRAGLEAGTLISPGTYDTERISHASYELGLGEAHVASLSAIGDREFTIKRLSKDQPLKLNPGEIARLYSLEVLQLPRNIAAFTVARGLLFVEGLAPENTYADPGFT